MADASPLVELIGIFERLRRECPWKAAQTHESLARYLIEESHEAVEAIESGDVDAMRDELGDVLLQVYLHAEIAAQTGAFDVEDVAAGLRDKMIRRNPHVFGDEQDLARTGDPRAINERWQEIKAQERVRDGILDGVPVSLPALARATKLVDRAARAGTPVAADAESADLGEQLLALVVAAHEAGVDPEGALRAAVRRRES